MRKSLIVYIHPPQWGHVAEWLRSGLQNRLHQFNSGRGLHQSLKACHPIKARNPVKALRPIFETGTRLRSRVIVPPDAGRDRAGQTAPDTALMRRCLTENDRFRRRRASSHARKNGRARARPSSHERAARREGAPLSRQRSTHRETESTARPNHCRWLPVAARWRSSGGTASSPPRK